MIFSEINVPVIRQVQCAADCIYRSAVGIVIAGGCVVVRAVVIRSSAILGEAYVTVVRDVQYAAPRIYCASVTVV